MDNSRAGSDVERNKEIFRRFQQDVCNRGALRIETLATYLSKDFIDHTAGPHDPPGLEGVHHRFLKYQAAFSRATEVNREVLGEADLVAVLYETNANPAHPTASHDPRYQDPP